MITASGEQRLPKRSRATLIVIDMQPGFEASHSPDTQRAVTREIHIAVRNGWPVVIVECRPESFGGTYPELLADLDRQPASLIGRAFKKHNNGTSEVLDCCLQRHFDLESLRVCGVNTTQCVEETVLGLSACLPSSCIEVVKDACNDWNENNFDRMLRCANVFLRNGDNVEVL
jgi:nicotinamidase-related amidase